MKIRSLQITPHTCNEAANAARIEVQKAVCQIKQRALMTMENPEQIRNAVIAEVPEIVLGKKQLIRKIIGCSFKKISRAAKPHGNLFNE